MSAASQPGGPRPVDTSATSPAELPPGSVAAEPLPIDYARLLYAGGARYRSWVGATLLTTAVGVAVACGAIVADPHADLPRGGRLAFATGAAVAAAAAVVLLAGIVADRREGFEITTAGIRTSAGLTPWPQVTRVLAGGSAAGPRVRLFFTRRDAAAGGGAVTTVQLPGTGRTPVAEYERLLATLRREVLPAYPHLDVGGYELPRRVARSSAARSS